MDILAVTFSSEFAGGANRSFLMVIKGLKNKYNHSVHVILPEVGPLEKELLINNISYEILPLTHKDVMLNGQPKDILRKVKANLIALKIYSIALKEKRRLRSEKIDIVYVNCANQLFGGFIAKMIDVPCVWHFRGRFNENNYYIHNQDRFYAGDSSEIIVISNSMVDILNSVTEIPNNKIHLIYNGLDEFPKEISKQNFENGIHCVICGRIIPAKGQLEAIKAIHILRIKGYDIYLHIAGSLHAANQAYLTELKDKVFEYNLESFVYFEDQIENMSQFREKMNIELMCSVCEPFGRVTVEGMRSGLLVIGANTGGTIDIIENSVNGFLYEQGNPEDLAGKIRFAIENQDLYKSVVANALSFSYTHFTAEENVSKINKLLLDTVGRRI